MLNNVQLAAIVSVNGVFTKCITTKILNNMKTWDLSKNHNSMTTYALNPPEIMIPKNSKVLHKYNVLQLFLCLLQKVYHYIWFAK